MANPFAVTTVRCAGPGCTKVRQECNHWFVVQVVKYVNGTGFSCAPLMMSRELGIDDRPVCGQACAQKLFEQWMQK
jgi:hypothetical protein